MGCISGFWEVEASSAETGWIRGRIGDAGPRNGILPVSFNLRFAGQQFDEESGLHYNHHRYYDPYLTVGYTQADPIGLDGGWNRFSYVDGDPLAAVDPSGLVKWSGRYHARMYAPSFGGGWVDFDLISECVNGKRYRIKMRGIGPVASFGPIPVSETYGTITFDDRQPILNPDYLEGTFMFYSYGVSVGKWSWSKGRSFARAGFGVAGNDDISFAEGFDIGVSGIRGWSKVLNRILENCPCQQ